MLDFLCYLQEFFNDLLIGEHSLQIVGKGHIQQVGEFLALHNISSLETVDALLQQAF